MKRFFATLLCITIFHNSWGKTFVDDEGNSWEYQVSESGEVSIIGIPPVTNLVIPAYIEAKPVVTLSSSLIWYRFEERVSVVEISIPATLTNIGLGVLRRSDVSKIFVDPANPKYAAKDNVLYQTRWRDEYYRQRYPDEWSLIWCGTEVTHLTIATNVTAFGQDTYRGGYDADWLNERVSYSCRWGGSRLKSIEVLEGNPIFSSINGMLFKGSYLCRCPPAISGNITIPQNVQSLNMLAFHGCGDLMNIFLDGDNPSFSAIDGVLYSKDGSQVLAVPGGRSIVEISSSAKSILTASRSPSLKTIVIPDGVESIEDAAFSDCDKLECLKLPGSVSKIPYDCFYGCSSLTSVTFSVGLSAIDMQAFAYCTRIENFDLPESITSLGDGAFQGCRMLGRVTMKGNAITDIPDRCFAWCSSLTSVVFSVGVEIIGEEAFAGCLGLRMVDLPPALELITTRAFDGAGLSEVSLAGNELSVEMYAFGSCSALNMVRVDHSVKNIDPRAFVSCSSISEYKLIDESAYYSVTNRCLCDRKMEQLLFVPYTFTELFVPTGIVTIGSYACSSHENLANVILPDTLERIEKSAFEGCLNLDEVTIPSRTTYIGNYAFENCNGIQYIDLPHSVLHLGDACFRGCGSLSVVNVSTNLENIGWSCFEDCGSLEEILIPSKVAVIEDSAFSGCTNLKSCVMMKGVTIIESDVWRNCLSLTNLVIPSSVQELDAAFFGCSNLVSISFVGNAPEISDGSYREYSTTNFNDTVGGYIIYSETIGSVTWYHYMKRITGYMFRGTSEELHIYVRPGSSGWIDDDVTGIPEEWPVDSINGRIISYDESIQDPDWIEEYRYKVPIKFNRYKEEDLLMPVTHYWYIGEDIEIPDAMGQEKSGFSFRGWSDGVNAYRPGEKYRLESGGVTFVPIWGSPNFILHYDSNGGFGFMTNEEYVVGAEVVLQTNAYSMSNREFLGWGDAPDGLAKYTDGERTVEISPLLGDDVFIYAIWSDVQMGIGEYLDCPELDFVTKVPSPWMGVSDVTHSTIGAMRSGCVTNGESVLSVKVNGEGRFEFWWKVSSETYKNFKVDYASFRVDGIEQSWIGGEIDWQQVVFDVTGDGEHTITWAYVKDADGSDGADAAWIDEVSWTPKAIPVDPIPDLGDEPTQTEIKTALDGSTDPDLVKHITNGIEYAAYRMWAMSVKKHDGSSLAGLQAVHDSENAWLSYALHADKLIALPPVQGDLNIDTFGLGASDGSFEFTISLKGVEIGPEASKENLKRVFGIEGTTSLSDEIFSSESVDIEFGTPVGGKVMCTAVPKKAKAKSFFIKMRMK